MSLWPNIDQLPDEKPLWKIPLSYIDGYNSGCIAQARADREAVGTCGVTVKIDGGVTVYRDDVFSRLLAAQIVKGE
jgi:hypothetical protein